MSPHAPKSWAHAIRPLTADEESWPALRGTDGKIVTEQRRVHCTNGARCLQAVSDRWSDVAEYVRG